MSTTAPSCDGLSPEALARWAHRGQHRLTASGPRDYIEHPARVVGLLVAGGVGDQEVLAAGWLHDVVEDQAARVASMASPPSPPRNVDKSADPLVIRKAAAEVIADAFGERVAGLVLEVTNPLADDPGGDDYLGHLRDLTAHGSPGALAVKICDHLDNTADLTPSDNDLRDPMQLARWRAKYAPVRPLLRTARSLLDPAWQARMLSPEV
ncbi:MAG: HD domain-containing protein [Acidipropionibacterium acidipropionici]|nr:HD domain-containing protein [Acidipropionibacterium acidipropionici]